MSSIPCRQNLALREKIEQFAETLRNEAHKLGDHGLDEREFYNSGLFRGAIERIRGQFSATMREKRIFVHHILNHLEDGGYISAWDLTDDANRNDYVVQLNSGKTAVIDLKGCLDGNNTNIFERPSIADEFVIWSVCSNPGADPRRNTWSGIHSRLSAEMISRQQRVDGVIVWDMVCGTIGKPCPKILDESRLTTVGPFRVPPPCVYLLPGSIPSVEKPVATGQKLHELELLTAFHNCFSGRDDEINSVDFLLSEHGGVLSRQTTIRRAQTVQQLSEPSVIRRV